MDAKHPLLEDSGEAKNVTDFIQMHGPENSGIIDLLNKFCVCLVNLENFRWPAELQTIFKEAYQLARSVKSVLVQVIKETETNFVIIRPLDELDRFHCQLPDVLHLNDDWRGEGVKSLVHAELLVCALRDADNASIVPVPDWFLEDLMFLFHLTDNCQESDLRTQSFRARVFWLHCCWHYHHGRIETALNHLERVSTPRAKGNLFEVHSCRRVL